MLYRPLRYNIIIPQLASLQTIKSSLTHHGIIIPSALLDDIVLCSAPRGPPQPRERARLRCRGHRVRVDLPRRVQRRQSNQLREVSALLPVVRARPNFNTLFA